jgi:hypothetical protein
MADPNEIAKAKVTVEADLSGMKDAVRETVAETEKLGDAADGAGSRVDASFSKAGEKIEESTKGVRKFVGALSSVAGVATGLIGVVGLVAGAFAGLLEIFKRLNGGDGEGIAQTRASLQGLFDDVSGANVSAEMFPVFLQLQDDIEETGKKVVKLRQQIDAAVGLDTETDLVFGIKNLGPRLRDAEQKLQSLLAQREALTRRAREAGEAAGEQMGDAMVDSFRQTVDQRANFLDTIRSQAESLRISLIGDDRERIKAETNLLLEQIDRIRQASGVASDNEDLTAYIELIRKGEAEKLNALDERIAKEKNADAEREAEKDRRSQERAQREVETIREGLESITAGEFTTVLASIPRVLQEVSSKLGRLK